MRNRRVSLAASFLIAVAIYAGLYVVAPHVSLLSANSSLSRVAKAIRVDLRVEAEPATLLNRREDSGGAATRAKSVYELLDEEMKDLPPAQRETPEVLKVAEIHERIAEESLERAYDLGIDAAALEGMEARVLAISHETARADIEVARRLIRPGETVLLDDGSTPVFRGLGDGGGAGGEGGGARLGGRGAAAAEVLSPLAGMHPAFEAGVVNPAPEIGEMPVIPDELIAIRELITAPLRAETPFEVIDDFVSVRTRTYVNPSTSQGYFELRIVPRVGGAIGVLPKDVTFVIDASNSIVQRKLDLTARGIQECLAMLRPEDRFNIVVFRNSPTVFGEESRAATPEAIEEAQAFLEDLESRGATDVYRAIGPLVARAPRAGLPGVIFVVSDGRPTAGALEGRALINALSAENSFRNTIYTFGGGKTVNRYLLDLLAYRNRGTSKIVPRIEDVDDALPGFFRGFTDAVLVGLHADFGQSYEASIYPRAVPDFYEGRDFVVYGRFEPGEDEEIVLRLQGEAGDVKKEMVLKADLANAPAGDSEIARQWAFEKSYYVIGEITRLGEMPELIAELRRLSERYGVETAYFR